MLQIRTMFVCRPECMHSRYQVSPNQLVCATGAIYCSLFCMTDTFVHSLRSLVDQMQAAWKTGSLTIADCVVGRRLACVIGLRFACGIKAALVAKDKDCQNFQSHADFNQLTDTTWANTFPNATHYANSCWVTFANCDSL